MVKDDQDRILMGKRNDTQKWTNPGGGCEGEECPYHAAIREFKEETGVSLESIKLIKVFFTSDTNLIYMFEGKMPKEYEFDTSKDPDEECDDWEFICPFSVADELHVPLDQNEIIKYWAEN